MACTVESDEVRAMEYGRISFGSLDDVINVDDMESFGQGMECLDQCKALGKHCTTKTSLESREQLAVPLNLVKQRVARSSEVQEKTN